MKVIYLPIVRVDVKLEYLFIRLYGSGCEKVLLELMRQNSYGSGCENQIDFFNKNPKESIRSLKRRIQKLKIICVKSTNC